MISAAERPATGSSGISSSPFGTALAAYWPNVRRSVTGCKAGVSADASEGMVSSALMDFSLISLHIARVSALLFDTLRLSRTLRDKGHFTPEQAEALAEALGEAGHGDLTKADLAALKADIAEVRAELKADIAEVKADILKWVVGAIGFQTVVILGALVSLVRIFAK